MIAAKPRRSIGGSSERGPLAGTITVVLVAALVLALPSVSRAPAVKAALVQADLVHFHQGFLALAFPTPSNVAGFVDVDGTATVEFSITNGYESTRRVGWTVTSYPDRGRSKVERVGTTLVAKGDTASERFQITVRCEQRTRVEIQLHSDEAVHPTIQFLAVPISGTARPDGRGPICTSNPQDLG